MYVFVCVFAEFYITLPFPINDVRVSLVPTKPDTLHMSDESLYVGLPLINSFSD